MLHLRRGTGVTDHHVATIALSQPDSKPHQSTVVGITCKSPPSSGLAVHHHIAGCPPRQTPPIRMPQRMQSNPQLPHTQAEKQAQLPLLSPLDHDLLESCDPIPRLASGRSSLGERERPVSVPSIGVSRISVRDRQDHCPSHPLPPHIPASSLYPSRIESPSPAPSSTNSADHPESLKIGTRNRQAQTPSPHHPLRSHTPYPHQPRHQTHPPVSPSQNGQQAYKSSQGRANIAHTRLQLQSSKQPSSTDRSSNAPAIESHHRSGDYAVATQIGMNSFIPTALPPPQPFRRVPTAEIQARRDKYDRLNGSRGDEEGGGFEHESGSWWRRGWWRWALGLLVWGLLWFVVGGALGLGMR